MSIHALLSTLQPRQAVHAKRRRLGRPRDGGYVILDHENLSDTVLYSYGIGDNDSFDRDFGKRYGVRVQQYDFSIAPPAEKEGFTFHQQGISHEKKQNCNTLQAHLEQNGDGDKRIFLKIDVEGAEWLSLLHTPESVLKQCNQIVIELHDLSGCGKTGNYPDVTQAQKIQMLEKITKHFHCWHVHANNYANIHMVDGFKVPDALEVTFINQALYPVEGNSTEYFPTKYDQPCCVRRKDTQLDFWPFYPQPEIKPVKRTMITKVYKKLTRTLIRLFR